MRRSFLPVFATCVGLSLAANAADPIRLLDFGKWQSLRCGTSTTTPSPDPLASARRGCSPYSPGGHMVIFLANEERPKPVGELVTDAERIANTRTTIAAYAGKYRVEGDKVIHQVTTAMNPRLNATDQVRHFRIDGEKLIVSTAPFKNISTGVNTIAFLTYKRLD